MSQKLVALNPDLKRLRDDGFNLAVKGTHLLVGDVPYVTANREVKRGILISVLELHQDRTRSPVQDHVVRFVGERPCDHLGNALNIVNSDARETLAPGLIVDFSFSMKPKSPYADYYEKITTYVRILSHQAQVIDPSVQANTFPLVVSAEDDSPTPFKFLDTASSRAGIEALNPKLAASMIAIIGLGGTGSFILDLVAKTPVVEIHLFDGDRFLQHNAFRSPGALGVEDLRTDIKKVHHYEAIYSKMRTGVTPHDYRLTEENATELAGMQFVFLCLDSGECKPQIIKVLEDADVPYIDADLNALNAALAVIKWKKICGFYHDLEREHHSTYVIETGRLSREDQ